MKTRIISTLSLLLLLSTSSFSQERQGRFAFELNGGASFATSEPYATELNPGAGFEFNLQYNLVANTSLYAGWGWNRFNAGESFAGQDICFEETGYVFGLQYLYQPVNANISLYARAAGLYNHMEIENPDGDIIIDSGHGLGYQLAAGLQVPMGEKWALTPGIKFNSLKRDAGFEGSEYRVGHDYLSLRIGILRRF